MNLTTSTIPIKFIQGESFTLSVIIPQDFIDNFIIEQVWIEGERKNQIYIELEKISDLEYKGFLSPLYTNNLSKNIKARISIKSPSFGIKKSNLFILICDYSNSENLENIYNSGIDVILHLNYNNNSLEISPQLLSLVKGDTGPSPYDLALENGFVGTLDQWLDSLKTNTIQWNSTNW